MPEHAPQVHAFGWKPSPINQHSLRVVGAAMVFLAAGLATLVFERNDLGLIALAWLVVVIAGAVLFDVVWPYLTIRGPVVEVGPDGVIDRRIVKAPVRWRDIETLYGGIGPDVTINVRPGRWDQVQKRRLRGLWARYGWGSGSFTIVEAPLEMRGADLYALCRDAHKAAKRARAAAAVGALERASAEGLEGAALDGFVDAIRDVPMLIPLFEEHHAQRFDVVEEIGGTRAMHVFTDNERYYTVTPQDYYSPVYPDEVFGIVAASYALDAIVINPGVGPEVRIGRARFGEIAFRLANGAQ